MLTRVALIGVIAIATIGAGPVTAHAAAGLKPAYTAAGCGPVSTDSIGQVPWGLQRLAPNRVWSLTQGQGVVVAVIDSGVSKSHPVMAGQVLPGRDFGLPEHAGQCDEVGHGTVIAGIIAGKDDTKARFSGIAPRAKILPVRVLRDASRSSDESLPARIAQAIRWAVDNHAKVINLSLETLPTSDLSDAVAYAGEHDVLLVAAAGNQPTDDQRNQPAYPAAYDSVLAVAGVDQSGKHVDSSVSGDYLDLAAPGVLIEGPAPRGGGYLVAAEGGTSYATAYVSGVAALLRAYAPELSATEVAQRLRLTADFPPEGRNPQVGYGVVNPYRAVATILGGRPNQPVTSLAPPAAAVDPLRTTRLVAVWAALVGAAAATFILLSQPLLRRGRQRGWRPGRRPA